MRIPLRLPATALAAALLLAACGNDAVGAAEDPSPAPGTDAPTDADALPDGDHFGFLTGVDAAAGTIAFDTATWVASDAEPNGYRIDNPEVTVVTLRLADDADIEVLMSTGDPSTATRVDARGLQDWAEGPAAGQELAVDIDVTGSSVTAVRFVYRP